MASSFLSSPDSITTVGGVDSTSFPSDGCSSVTTAVLQSAIGAMSSLESPLRSLYWLIYGCIKV